MTTLNTPFYIQQKSQDALINFCKQTQEAAFHVMDMRSRFEYIDKEYIRENQMVEQSLKSKQANELGDKRKIQDMVIPVVEPQVETAHTFLTSVFLTGNPIFDVVSDLQNIDQARSMSAVMGENAIRGGWTRELSLFFRDGLKYNFSALEACWCREKIWSLQTDTSFSKDQGRPKELLWQGNKLKRLDPYNTIFDPRIPLTEQHKRAEFVGYVELENRMSLTEWIQSLPNRMNVTKAMEASSSDPNFNRLFWIPNVYQQNFNFSKLQGIMDWNRWAFGSNITDIRVRFKNLYLKVTRYIKIIPKDFQLNVPQAGQPQIWKLVTINDQIIVYAERQTNAHGMMPIIFGQPIEDGLNLQTKSFAQKQIPFQDIASTLANSKLAARRRLVADRMLYDPSRIRPEDINSDSPTAKIPVKPSAYGQPLEKAVYHIPFRDDQTQTLMSDVREVKGYSDEVSGQNRAQQGQFVKGNKTQVEYEDVQHNASGRQRAMAILLEAQVFTPIKEILKLNILQYQPTGDVYSYVDKKSYNVDPVELRKVALSMKVSDGIAPSEKLISGDVLTSAFQVIAQSEELSQEYSVGDIFAYLMKTRGADLDQFKLTQQQVDANHQRSLQTIQAQGQADAAGQVAAQQAKQPPQQQPVVPAR